MLLQSQTGLYHCAEDDPAGCKFALKVARLLPSRPKKAEKNQKGQEEGVGHGLDVCEEYELLGRLQRPNITAAFALVTSSHEYLGMVLELATVSLEECLYGVIMEMPLRNKWTFLYHACAGLIYLHSKRILHLDIKPGNMLLFGHPESSDPGACTLKLFLGNIFAAFVCFDAFCFHVFLRCDFGFCRSLKDGSDKIRISKHVYSAPYRAAEIWAAVEEKVS